MIPKEHGEELQKRADEVFCLDEGDLVISVEGEKNSTRIRMYNEISLKKYKSRQLRLSLI